MGVRASPQQVTSPTFIELLDVRKSVRKLK